MFFEARITNCVTSHHLQCLVRSQNRQLPSGPRRGGRRPGWREQRAVSSVACSARSEMVWATVTQGCGRGGLALGYNICPLRGLRTEPRTPASAVRTACVGFSTGGFVTPEPGGQKVDRSIPHSSGLALWQCGRACPTEGLTKRILEAACRRQCRRIATAFMPWIRAEDHSAEAARPPTRSCRS